MSKPMSEQIQKLADKYEKATGKKFGAKTNAQKIRAMSDEELAEVLSLLTKNDVCVNTSAVFCTGCPFDAFCSDCKEGNELEWLQQPAEEDDHDERKENENVRR